MTWVRLDDGFYDHPKVIAAGPAAAWLHVCGLGYSSRHLTDGRIPKAILNQLSRVSTPAKHAARLVEVGMWLDHGDHYQIHDYLHYQPSREKVLADRDATKERVAKSRARRAGNTPGNSVTAGDVTPSVTALYQRPDPTRPDPSTGTYILSVLSTEQTKKNRRPA